MKDLQKKIDTSIIFITHDLGVVANVADRVAVMYGGKIVEIGTVDEIFYNPQHPYTWGLISSMPSLDTMRNRNYMRFLVHHRIYWILQKGMHLHCVMSMLCKSIWKNNHQCLKFLIHIMLQLGYCIQMHQKWNHLLAVQKRMKTIQAGRRGNNGE